MVGRNGSAPEVECYVGCEDCARERRAHYSCQRCRLFDVLNGCPLYEGCRSGMKLGALPEHFQSADSEGEETAGRCHKCGSYSWLIRSDVDATEASCLRCGWTRIAPKFKVRRGER